MSVIAREKIPMKTVKLGDFLTDAQIEQCRALYPDRARIRDEVIQPNMEAINLKLGQENDADYLAYAIVYTIDRGGVALEVEKSS
jgi:hypothetical protein